MLNIAIVVCLLCMIKALQCDAFVVNICRPSPNYDISRGKRAMKQNVFPSDVVDKSYYWNKKSSSRSSSNELYASPTTGATTIEQTIEVANHHSIINDRSMTTTTSSLSVGMISMIASLVAIELVAQATNSLHLAVSTRLLSIHFWSALTRFGPIAVRLAPIPTILKIRKTGAVGGLPLLPYSAMANLSFVLLMYGIMRSDPHIIITYAIGLAMSLYYCAQYLRHCPPNASHLPRTAQFHKHVTLGIIAFILCSITFLGKDLASLIVGITSVILSCSMYISPLSKMFKAIREKSAKDIPLPFAIVGLINTFSWVIHGLFVKKDFVLWLPCAIGVVSTSTQILLNILWGNGRRDNTMVPV